MNKNTILTITFITILSLLSPGNPAIAANERIIIHSVSVKNILINKTPDQLKNEIELISRDNYQIAYIHRTGYFIIRILSAPIDQARKQSETTLINLLDINEAQACKLSVLEAIPHELNDDDRLKELGLSFCNNDADINRDGVINGIDYARVVTHYNRIGKNIAEDINGDEIVNSLDLSLVIKSLGERI